MIGYCQLVQVIIGFHIFSSISQQLGACYGLVQAQILFFYLPIAICETSSLHHIVHFYCSCSYSSSDTGDGKCSLYRERLHVQLRIDYHHTQKQYCCAVATFYSHGTRCVAKPIVGTGIHFILQSIAITYSQFIHVATQPGCIPIQSSTKLGIGGSVPIWNHLSITSSIDDPSCIPIKILNTNQHFTALIPCSF